jgi:glycosyltransferase involved in cell wall biosynthesis
VRILVNTQHLLSNRLEGIGWFAHETLSRIVANHPEHEFIFVFDRPWSEEFVYGPNVMPVKTTIPSRHPVLWYWHYEVDIPAIARRYKPDVFFSPDGWMPLNLGIPVVDVIHDLNFVHRPSDFPFFYRKYYNHFFPKFARQASRIITVSKYSKSDIMKVYGIDAEKIDVAYNGCNTMYQPVSPDIKVEVRNRFTSGMPYFIHIGSQNPRKNIPGLIRAFDQFKEFTNSNYKLLLVGEPMWNHYGMKNIEKEIKNKDEVVFTGRVSSEVLHLLLASAEALALVSFSEGFGIPVVEAFYCDVPVLCSNVASLPEVAGDAALLIDPRKTETISNAMAEIAYDKKLRTDLVEKARFQRLRFNWNNTARIVWESIVNATSR